MAALFLVVNAMVDESVEERWNDWYSNQHVPDIMNCPGFISAKRLVTEDDGGRKYMAIYELQSDAAIFSEQFQKVTGWGEYSKHIQSESALFNGLLDIHAEQLIK